MKINKRLIEKMIKRIEEVPEGYDQSDFKREWGDDPDDTRERPKPPCGAVACLAGEAIISNARTPQAGARKLLAIPYQNVEFVATSLLRIDDDTADALFNGDAHGWPEPYYSQFQNAKSYKTEAKAAVGLLKAILKTDGKVLEQ